MVNNSEQQKQREMLNLYWGVSLTLFLGIILSILFIGVFIFQVNLEEFFSGYIYGKSALFMLALTLWFFLTLQVQRLIARVWGLDEWVRGEKRMNERLQVIHNAYSKYPHYPHQHLPKGYLGIIIVLNAVEMVVLLLILNRLFNDTEFIMLSFIVIMILLLIQDMIIFRKFPKA